MEQIITANINFGTSFSNPNHDKKETNILNQHTWNEPTLEDK
jgi:hypothetical protein